MTSVASVGFPPLVGDAPRILILGSLPGRASLAAGQYYAMPRNLFWTVVSPCIGGHADASYAARCTALIGARIALWDVCASAHRPGSLDARIDRQSVQPNPIGALLAQHPSIQTLLFNGRAAAQLYARHVVKTLPPGAAALPCTVLPSTSPAHAAVSRSAKTARWHAALHADAVDRRFYSPLP
jgi:double-stranded uracil-DNA glycosylase